MIPRPTRSKGHRNPQSNGPSSSLTGAVVQQQSTGAQSPTNISNFPFTFEYTLHSAAPSVRIEADEHPSPSRKTWDDVSITSSISAYRVENGRTYHAYRDGSYPYPNDEMELARYEWMFICLKHLFGGRNYFAPLSKHNPPSRILDIATGTGTWAIEMSDEFPNAEVYGTDLSPIQPSYVPENVHFYIDDALEDWVYPELLDYIHIRMALGVWQDFEMDCARKAFENLRPGGWFEAQELFPGVFCDDGTMPDDWPFKRLLEDLEECAEQIGRSLRCATVYKQALMNAGFVDVQQITFKIPINNWPKNRKWKELGGMWKGAFEGGGLQAMSMGLLHRVRGLKREQIELHLVDIRRALADTSVHAYEKVYVVIGRKPFPGEVCLRPPNVPTTIEEPMLEP
ncbi:hypothetical protein DL770_011683 [Monosporascus sp. CRB-9-2]|nr:hypothetical protein DL770_011683 [Monosporascus sp. CRB-9-2]